MTFSINIILFYCVTLIVVQYMQLHNKVLKLKPPCLGSTACHNHGVPSSLRKLIDPIIFAMVLFIMGILRLSSQVVQNRQTGEQLTHWNMLNKENSNLLALFNMSQGVICSSVWRFCTT